jgi:hypothetical protein
MKKNVKDLSPRSPSGRDHDLSRPLRLVLKGTTVLRVEIPGEMPHWLTAGPKQKQALVAEGAPSSRVWTTRELESLPWKEQPLTLATCLKADGTPAGAAVILASVK